MKEEIILGLEELERGKNIKLVTKIILEKTHVMKITIKLGCSPSLSNPNVEGEGGV